MIYITKDNFVWLDVTEQLTQSPRAWVENEIYAVHDDDSHPPQNPLFGLK